LKRSNPTRSVPHPKRDDHAAGEVPRDRSTTDFAGASARKRKRTEMQQGWAMRSAEATASTKRLERRTEKRGRVAMEGGSFPVNAPAPKPPPVLVLYDDLADELGEAPEPVYGQYPRAFIGKMLPWLRCARHEVLHVCSGCLPPGEGVRVDIREAAKPDILADGRSLPMRDGEWQGGIMLDPPYTTHYARELYGVEYPRPSHLLREAARVIRPGGRIVFVHYITPKPPEGTRFVKAFGLSTGFDMPIRAVTVFEKEQARLPLEGG
jgi:hypothetical protein